MSDQYSNQVDLGMDGVWPTADRLDPDGIVLCSTPLLPPKAVLARIASDGTIHFPEGVHVDMPPHVEAFARDVAQATGVSWISTYPDHDPDISHALDIFVPVNDRSKGDEVAQFSIDHEAEYGIWYRIFRAEIYNRSVADYWRQMGERAADKRGTAYWYTQNHYDHVHVSFNADAPEEDFLAALSDDEQQELLANTRHLRVVFDEMKREESDATGQPNWHLTGEARNAQWDLLVNMLADLKADVAELKKQ